MIEEVAEPIRSGRAAIGEGGHSPPPAMCTAGAAAASAPGSATTRHRPTSSIRRRSSGGSSSGRPAQHGFDLTPGGSRACPCLAGRRSLSRLGGPDRLASDAWVVRRRARPRPEVQVRGVSDSVTIGPDERALRDHLQSARFQAGVNAGPVAADLDRLAVRAHCGLGRASRGCSGRVRAEVRAVRLSSGCSHWMPVGSRPDDVLPAGQRPKGSRVGRHFPG